MAEHRVGGIEIKQTLLRALKYRKLWGDCPSTEGTCLHIRRKKIINKQCIVQEKIKIIKNTGKILFCSNTDLLEK